MARRGVLAIALAGLLVACTSPEAARVRGGGPGADPGNRSVVVQMHEGSLPYHETPRLIEPYGLDALAPARQAHRLSLDARGEEQPRGR
ncbi:MAG TPA: hypothetical protein VNN07_16325 [Candidatus Tectomicrobia bacterium]|nr:hypothetical protein [Candidatus Tectomicrobia bacterium]